MPKSNEHFSYQPGRETSDSGVFNVGNTRERFNGIFGANDSQEPATGLSAANEAFRNARNILNSAGISQTRHNLRKRLRGNR